MALDLGLFRRHRVNLIRQTELAECGLVAIAMVANFHGLETDLGALRRRFQPSLRGATLKSLIAMADEIGLAGRAVKLPLEQLRNLRLPAILHWEMRHYVVLEAVRGEKALIHNPTGWSRWMPISEVSDYFTGVALELTPTEDFRPGREHARLRLYQLWSRVTGLKRAILQTLVLSLVMQAYVLAAPYYMQVALDAALPALDVNLLTVLAIGFGLFAVFNVLAGLLRSFVLLSAGASMGYGIAVNLARRLLRLPVAWFEKRHVGDVLSRFQSILPIRQFLTEGPVATLLDGSLAIFTLVLMFFYSPALTIIALLAFGAYATVRTMTFGVQRRAQEDALEMTGREQSTMIESVRGIATLRLFNREAARHAFWQTRLTDSVNAAASVSRIAAWQAGASTLIFSLETILSVWLAVRMMIDGGFSAGMVFAYLAYKSQFLLKAVSLTDQAVSYRMLELHLERLSEIALTEQDPCFERAAPAATELQGRLELRDIGFRYSPLDPKILNGVNLTVEAGEHVAITGPSGGGKSTLVKIMLGLIEPTEGEVWVDGVPLGHFGYKSLRSQAGAVLQDDHLFAGSLAENIALFDESPDFERIVEAAKTAALHDDIQKMLMGYETLVGDMGSSLSGGQKQRLLLARALYRQPRLLVMDEATSHLDFANEQAVAAAIQDLGITRIVIAHRLETIMAASRILAVENGVLTDITAEFTGRRSAHAI